MGDWTGTVPDFAAGDKFRGEEAQILADIDTALTDSWTVWVPTFTNITAGAAGVSARYRRLGKTVDWRLSWTFGAGSAVGSSPTFTLPFTPHADYINANFAGVPVGQADLVDASGGLWVGLVIVLATNVASWLYSTEAGAGSVAAVTATLPFTWTTGDRYNAYGSYEAA